MRSQSKITSAVDARHESQPKFTAREDGHTPYNKRPWEIEASTAVLEITDCPTGPQGGQPWLSFALTETTQAKPGGPFQTRTISMDLHGEDRARLIEMLKGGQ